MSFKVGDKVKNLVELVTSYDGSTRPIPVGSVGTIMRVDGIGHKFPIAFPYEVSFECYTKDTYPCNEDELEGV